MKRASPFRRAREADVPGLLDLVALYYRDQGYPFDRRAARAVLRSLIRRKDLGAMWVAPENAPGPSAAPLAGYLVVTFGYSLEHRGRDAFVDEVFVAPSHRGRGLGEAALELAERFAAKSGVRALHLEVERGNAAASRLYRKRGFRDRGRTLLTKSLAAAPGGASGATPTARGTHTRRSKRRGRASRRS